MKEKEIYEQFLKASGIPEEDIIDYRYCTKFYAEIDVPNAITVQLKNGKCIIYESYDISKVVEELEAKKQNALDVEESIKEYNVWKEAIEIVKQGCVIDERRRIKLLSS